jgi:hypothetical protein
MVIDGKREIEDEREERTEERRKERDVVENCCGKEVRVIGLRTPILQG